MADLSSDDALGAALTDLAGHLRTSEQSLWPRVLADLDPLPRPRVPVRGLAIAAIAVLVVLVAVAAIAPARRAVADLLGIGSTTVTHVDGVRSGAATPRLQPEGSEAALRRRLGTAGLALPDAALVGDPRGWRVDLSGETIVEYDDVTFGERAEGTVPALKRVPEQGQVEAIRVGEEPGYWIPGPHTRTIAGRTVRSASVLLWVADGLELRLEGDVTLTEMLEIARSVRRLR
ncbi:MAG: hypothetical protein ABW033_02765 [Acidimicrobiia bacterium]